MHHHHVSSSSSSSSSSSCSSRSEALRASSLHRRRRRESYCRCRASMGTSGHHECNKGVQNRIRNQENDYRHGSSTARYSPLQTKKVTKGGRRELLFSLSLLPFTLPLASDSSQSSSSSSLSSARAAEAPSVSRKSIVATSSATLRSNEKVKKVEDAVLQKRKEEEKVRETPI